MQKLLLLGDEAIAQGAIDSGISGIYAYPGTPSTEILEYVQRSKDAKERNIHRKWSSNEKTALESALGMSYAGKRVMACMKHVGLNVAADPFMNSSITGANGGLVIVSADDPSMHSSQNEQDSRYFGKFALMPIFEPSNQQESYDMVHHAFDFSEKYKIPVLFRIATRLAHSRAGVKRQEIKKQNELSIPKNLQQYVLLPAIARKNYKELIKKQDDFEKESENSPFNKYIDGKDKSLGIVACGLAYNYLLENFENKEVPYPVVKISQYPIPPKILNKLKEECNELLVLEDGYPLVEEMLKGFYAEGITIKGRLDGSIPRDGELNSNLVAKALGISEDYSDELSKNIVGRPPSFCKGCSHIDSYNALDEALAPYSKGRVMADIGCYTLAALKPFQSINSCVDMGASITMAIGLADAGKVPAVAVIGDSTFTHSGMTGLLDAIIKKSPITVLILDNSTTGMTGGQDSQGFGRIENICEGLGVDKEHIKILNPIRKYHDENVKVIKEELEYNGVSVVIPRRECVQTIARRNKLIKQKKINLL
ncbi:MAG: thiamine pyrophosphate-dependent enzyme [Bacteroidota bacterium]|nr:thiamine pyrophosphate-dependent enzyme [Bacteroidota bacterium]